MRELIGSHYIDNEVVTWDKGDVQFAAIVLNCLAGKKWTADSGTTYRVMGSTWLTWGEISSAWIIDVNVAVHREGPNGPAFAADLVRSELTRIEGTFGKAVSEAKRLFAERLVWADGELEAVATKCEAERIAAQAPVLA